MAEKKRQANFELLRILAMLMVVAMHFLSRTGGLPEAGASILQEGASQPGFLSGKELFGVLAESLCIAAVNVYVLISGYFLSESGFRLRRLLGLLLQILFYTLLIPVVLMLTGVTAPLEAFNIYRIWQSIFPVESGHYWFITAYVVLYLFVPVLNAAVHTLSKKQLQTAIAGLLLFFSVGKSLSVLLFASDRYGYDFGWFICLYLIAAYIRSYGIAFFSTVKKSFGVYLTAVAVTAGLVLISLFIYYKTGDLQYYSTVPFHYNFIVCLIAALGLFYTFRYLRIASERISRWICTIASGTLGVYLIHEQIDVSSRWADWVVPQPSGNPGVYAVQMAAGVLVVFVLCTAAELLRARIFGVAGRMLLRTKAGRNVDAWIGKVDGIYSEKKYVPRH